MNRIAPARGAAVAAPSHLTGHVRCGNLRQHVNKYHRFAGLPWDGQGVKLMPFVAHVLLHVIAALCGHGHLTVSLASSHRPIVPEGCDRLSTVGHTESHAWGKLSLCLQPETAGG